MKKSIKAYFFSCLFLLGCAVAHAEVYRAQEGFVNLDLARQRQIDPNERDNCTLCKASEEDPFGEVTAGPNSHNLTERGIELYADLLFWHASEEPSSFVANTEKAKPRQRFVFEVNEMKFDWDVGVRGGLGYELPCNLWDTQLYWTWYETDATTRLHQRPNEDIDSEFFAGFMTEFIKEDQILSGRVNWNIFYSIGDWELGRKFAVGHSLILRPFIGIKGGVINQTIHATWNSATKAPVTYFSGKEKVENNFRGIGPSFGLDTTWKFVSIDKHTLSAFGNGSLATLYGSWELKDSYRDPRPQEMKIHMDRQQFGELMLRCFAGLGWDYSRFSAKLGYEMQVWFSQLRLTAFQQLILHGDLILQGMTLECRMNF